jgi:hypothetical protein
MKNELKKRKMRIKKYLYILHLYRVDPLKILGLPHILVHKIINDKLVIKDYKVIYLFEIYLY